MVTRREVVAVLAGVSGLPLAVPSDEIRVVTRGVDGLKAQVK